MLYAGSVSQMKLPTSTKPLQFAIRIIYKRSHMLAGAIVAERPFVTGRVQDQTKKPRPTLASQESKRGWPFATFRLNNLLIRYPPIARRFARSNIYKSGEAHSLVFINEVQIVPFTRITTHRIAMITKLNASWSALSSAFSCPSTP